MLPQPASLPDAKSRLRFLLHDSDPHPSAPPVAPPPLSNTPAVAQPLTPLPPSSNLPTATPSSAPDTPSTRLQALNLAAEPLPTVPVHSATSNIIADRPLPSTAYRLPPLPTPVRARSADSAIVQTLPVAHVVGSSAPTPTSPYVPDTLLPPHPLTPPTRSDSAISDISTGAPGTTSRALTAATHPPRNHTHPLAHLHSQTHAQAQLIPRDAASFSSGPSLESMHVVPAGTSTVTAPSWDGARMSTAGTGLNPGAASSLGGLGNASDMSSALLTSVGAASLQQSQQHPTQHAMAALPTAMSALLPSRRPAKTEAELRDKREMRRMKNRISAARSRQRKTDTFETLQRELSEAKTVIEALTRQLDRSHGGRDHAAPGAPAAPPAPHVIAVPHDLRPAVGRDFVSVDVLMDMLRVYIRHATLHHN